MYINVCVCLSQNTALLRRRVHTSHHIYTPIFYVEFLFSTLRWHSSPSTAEVYKFKTRRLGSCVMFERHSSEK